MNDSAWVQTYTNKRFHILNPRSEEICIEDIAHALAMQCRFTGHTKFHYSVAQHCFYASTITSPSYSFEALMHDASEAYIGDMSRPMKHLTLAGEEYLKVESRIENAIALKFQLPEKMSPEVKNADNAMLYAEKSQIMGLMEWDTRWAENPEEASVKIERWSIERAEEEFLSRFVHLYHEKRVVA